MPFEGSPKKGAVNSFGSVHTTHKLEVLGEYMRVYSTALKNQPSRYQPYRRHYLDAFAGTGKCEITVQGGKKTIVGSAQLAINCNPPFDHLVFIESSRAKVRELNDLKQAAAGRDIEVLQGDANVDLPARLAQLNIGRDRAVVFLDPFGMQVAWETLRAIAETKFVDMLYLFPLSGLYRQATRSAADLTTEKIASLDRIFGTHDWRTAFYAQQRQQSLFQTVLPDERIQDVPGMLAWVKGRLETIFPTVVDPLVLYQQRQDGQRGAPNFALFFAMSNPNPRATELGRRLMGGVLKKFQTLGTGPK
jgi:three-Cys-motif partner protein